MTDPYGFPLFGRMFLQVGFGKVRLIRLPLGVGGSTKPAVWSLNQRWRIQHEESIETGGRLEPRSLPVTEGDPIGVFTQHPEVSPEMFCETLVSCLSGSLAFLRVPFHCPTVKYSLRILKGTSETRH